MKVSGYKYVWKGQECEECAPGVVKNLFGTYVHRYIPMYYCHLISDHLQKMGLLRQGLHLPALIDSYIEHSRSLPPKTEAAA